MKIKYRKTDYRNSLISFRKNTWDILSTAEALECPVKVMVEYRLMIFNKWEFILSYETEQYKTAPKLFEIDG